MSSIIRKLTMSLSILTLLCVLLKSNAVPINNGRGAIIYLQKFGYLEDNSLYRRGAGSVEDETVVNAIKDFQGFYGLERTGVLDSNTMAKMNVPRCGVKDKDPSHTRRKRFVVEGSRWTVKRLTYRISKYPTRLKDTSAVDREIVRAFKVWSDVTDLSFEPRTYSRVNIDIRFEARHHNDVNAFDGPGGVFAHARYPQAGGDVHFDDEETWTIDEDAGENLFQIAAHEFGHSLGLNHSQINESAMHSIAKRYDPEFRLHEDDIAGIHELYGKARKPVLPISSSDGSPEDIRGAPNLCEDPAMDTILYIPHDGTYIFKGDYYWLINQDRIVDGYPKRIFSNWDGLEGNLDASLIWSNGKIFFFKGDSYWRFSNRTMDAGYPKLISVGFEGIPDNVDAALVWHINGKSYFFKGDQYWKYDYTTDPPVDERYPRPISNWQGLPDNLDAAVRWQDNTNYFFKGDQYYRFNDVAFAVSTDPTYPRPIVPSWFSC